MNKEGQASLRLAVFGEVAFNERLGWYEGLTRSAEGRDVKTGIDLAVVESKAVLQQAADQVGFLLGDSAKAKEFACDKLLGIKNESWLGEGEQPLSRAEFVSHLQLESISINDEGGMQLFFLDNGLFRGHAVVISMTVDGVFFDADIFG